MNKINIYVVEDAYSQFINVRYVLEKILKSDEYNLDVFWISPNGDSKQLQGDEKKLFEYEFESMKPGLEKLLNELRDKETEKYLFMVDLCLNEKERERIKHIDPSEYIAKTSKQIVKLIQQFGRKIIIISSIRNMEDIWNETLDLYDESKDIIFFATQSLVGGGDLYWIKQKVCDFLELDK